MKEALKHIFTKEGIKDVIKGIASSTAKRAVRNTGEKVADKISDGVQDKLTDMVDKVDDGLLEKISNKLPDSLKTLFNKNKNVTTEYLLELIRSIDISEKLDELSKNEFLKKALKLNTDELKEYNDKANQ